MPFKKGGMGEIFKGIEDNTKEDVILKLVFIDDPSEEELLSREIDSSKMLTHENLVQTIHTGKIAIDGNNYLFLIQKYYPNGNLRSLIKNDMPLDICFTMMKNILQGLQEIHKIIVHRDMKPENVLVDNNGQLRITDFGLAKYIDEKTRTKSFKGAGTIPYSAPECWMGDNNSPLMDIYAVGIIFFEILTGKYPYSATSELEWRNCHIYEPIPDISNYRSGLNTKINQIVQKMTEKNISKRFKTANEVLNALNDAIKIQVSNDREIEMLASLGNIAMQQATALRLKKEKEKEKRLEWIKLLNYHITKLLKDVIDKVNAINERFETGKISLQQSQVDDYNTNQTLKLTFNSKSVLFNFANYDSVEKNEKRYYENSINFQRENYGMVMQSPRKTYLGESNFVLVGLAETTFKLRTNEYGFNLLLKIMPDEPYGEWYKMVFSKNIQPPETSFGIDLSTFFNDYDEFRGHPMFTVKTTILNDNDINDLLKNLFS